MSPTSSYYHAHFYFESATRDSAAKIRDALIKLAVPEVEIGPLRDHPVGPHPLPMFYVGVPQSAFGPVVSWLMLNHSQHAVLIHPRSGNDLLDHTEYALWLGRPVPLDFSKLD